MKRVVFILMLLLASVPVLHADEREIAESFYAKAKSLYERGDLETSKALLVEAVAIRPDFSETLFLLGKILCSAQETTSAGVPYIESAVSRNTWTVTPSSTAEEELASIYVRTRRYGDALARVNSLRARRVFTADIEIARALALYGLGDIAGGDVVFESALQLFPRESEIYRLYIKALLRRGNKARAAQFVERGLQEFSGLPVFISFKLALATDAGEKKKLFSRYLEAGGADPSIALKLTESDTGKSDTDTFRSLLDFFMAKGGDADLGLLQQLLEHTRGSKERFDLVADRLGTLEGIKTIDSDEDGYYEEKYVFEEGSVVQVHFDRNQDGAAEIEIELTDDLPTVIIHHQDAQTAVEYRYNGYPRVTAAHVRANGRTIRYELVPDAFTFAPVAEMPQPGKKRYILRLADSVRFPEEKDLLRFSFYSIEDATDKKTPDKKWELFNGRRLVYKEDADHDGYFERTVIYDDRGMALRGVSDMDGDGFFEIIETYVNGNLAQITYDENKDGRPDFTENGQGTRKEWDLNSDGIPDVVETINAEGKRVLQYTGILQKSR